VITVNNPSIWRPILGIEDAATAYIRAVEANYKLSGIFNVASGNYTVGEVADLVKGAVEDRLEHSSQPQHQAHPGFSQLQGQHCQSEQCAELSPHRKR
jgi:nucleoside-diphosphate-sugar epimerase